MKKTNNTKITTGNRCLDQLSPKNRIPHKNTIQCVALSMCIIKQTIEYGIPEFRNTPLLYKMQITNQKTKIWKAKYIREEFYLTDCHTCRASSTCTHLTDYMGRMAVPILIQTHKMMKYKQKYEEISTTGCGYSAHISNYKNHIIGLDTLWTVHGSETKLYQYIFHNGKLISTFWTELNKTMQEWYQIFMKLEMKRIKPRKKKRRRPLKPPNAKPQTPKKQIQRTGITQQTTNDLENLD